VFTLTLPSPFKGEGKRKTHTISGRAQFQCIVEDEPDLPLVKLKGIRMPKEMTEGPEVVEKTIALRRQHSQSNPFDRHGEPSQEFDMIASLLIN
jgi:hypothetical protein